jgi:hypothetical protein
MEAFKANKINEQNERDRYRIYLASPRGYGIKPAWYRGIYWQIKGAL